MPYLRRRSLVSKLLESDMYRLCRLKQILDGRGNSLAETRVGGVGDPHADTVAIKALRASRLTVRGLYEETHPTTREVIDRNEK